jgi:hypothetical protein
MCTSEDPLLSYESGEHRPLPAAMSLEMRQVIKVKGERQSKTILGLEVGRLCIALLPRKLLCSFLKEHNKQKKAQLLTQERSAVARVVCSVILVIPDCHTNVPGT